ncbi:OmpA family protein [Phaeovibrio sulfidiphilus]|uniref:OmpA family protein n=1 Tax=Phaeovibrio sulfidiphilus TaxID=1220600 RepID=A0A8J6Z179_9PROT|nr:OmpA family protein [Phaeovibrio sulfidiphilus]MBE1237883.1 OmpA family protein [Phaeovibrio sulfidiphilus]
MRKIFSSLALAGVVAVAPAIAGAQTPEGPYVAIHGGVNWMQDADVTSEGITLKSKKDTGYAVGGAIGYAFGNVGFGSPRVEFEGTWRSNGIDSLKWGGVNYLEKKNIDINTAALMVNALFDFDTGTALYPYIGGGVGAVLGWIDMPRGVKDGSDTAFGYQGIAGVGYNITDNFGMTVDYRYLGTTSFKDGGVKYEGLGNHTVMVGLRYAFGAPAAAPAPVAQQEVYAVPDSYMVFFDFDRSNVTPEAAGIIAQAASNAQSKGSSVINVTGHTDTVGSQAYNLRLSQRRAESVMAELERNGIPRSAIAVYAKGKSEPLVATGDGVREPQNRRVVIVLN